MAVRLSAAAFDPAAFLRAGDRVIVGQAAAEPLTLTEAVAEAADRIGDLELFLGVGFSRTFTGQSPAALRFAAYGAMGTAADIARAGRLDPLPMPYSELGAAFASGAQRADVVLLQLAETAEGFNLGLANDYTVEAARRARTVIAEVNPQVPATGRAALPADIRVDVLVEAKGPPLCVPSMPVDATAERIAGHISGLVPEGATIQIGIGSIPDAILSVLKGHRNLGFHSGVMTDRVLDLIEAGALTNAAKSFDQGVSITNTVIGTERLYRYADRNPAVAVPPSPYTHGLAVLSRLPSFFAINGGLEVDLAGRVNSESAGGKPTGGTGGLIDFIRGARASQGGRGIIALPSTAAGGKLSRIVPRVAAVTLGPSDADMVVTEHGVADLRWATAAERARRLIAIADPRFREELERGL